MMYMQVLHLICENLIQIYSFRGYMYILTICIDDILMPNRNVQKLIKWTKKILLLDAANWSQLNTDHYLPRIKKF